ncbi:hypothetical protein GUITHDRAFT_118822 [Guillardia theta CCMP2712]|uniref:Uncharacterized protein n=1 Tax=Guillardia theta (strain CCMP2712) TaxID=905079 RepID=L1IFH1_GUITC|nr:hypothetical protein GUITHDRAFT_118822 [Guillardia theta CCMP2712]EKX34983.1 hypothetical protein GUITHDRAFT_118822 [Guillardia theta CCMP2712]|eukprot:XP_005821963.1 hypothetical protein GUITHDRAFT_118822 [Guillardia theta CCMP2712]
MEESDERAIEQEDADTGETLDETLDQHFSHLTLTVDGLGSSDLLSSVDLESPDASTAVRAQEPLVSECFSQKFEILRTPERSRNRSHMLEDGRGSAEGELGLWHELISKTSPSRSSIEEALRARNSISVEEANSESFDASDGGRDPYGNGNKTSDEVKRACEIMADRAKQDMMALERELLEFTREMELNFIVEKNELTSMYEDQVWRLKQDLYYASQKECQLLEELDETQQRNQSLQAENKTLRQKLLESRIETSRLSEDLEEASSAIYQMTAELEELSAQNSSNMDKFQSENKSMERRLFVNKWENDRVFYQLSDELRSAEEKLAGVESSLLQVQSATLQLQERNQSIEHALSTSVHENKFLSFKVKQKSEECLKLHVKAVDDVSRMEHCFDVNRSAQLVEFARRTSSNERQHSSQLANPHLLATCPADPEDDQEWIQEMIREHDEEVKSLRSQLESIYVTLDKAKQSETLLFPFTLEIFKELNFMGHELDKVKQETYRYFKQHVRSSEVGMTESMEVLRGLLTDLYQLCVGIEMATTGGKSFSFSFFDLLLNASSDLRLDKFHPELQSSCQQLCCAISSGLDKLAGGRSSRGSGGMGEGFVTPMAAVRRLPSGGLEDMSVLPAARMLSSQLSELDRELKDLFTSMLQEKQPRQVARAARPTDNLKDATSVLEKKIAAGLHILDLEEISSSQGQTHPAERDEEEELEDMIALAVSSLRLHLETMEEMCKLRLESLYHRKRFAEWMDVVGHEIAELQSSARTLFLPCSHRPDSAAVSLSILRAVVIRSEEPPSLLQVTIFAMSSRSATLTETLKTSMTRVEESQGQHTATWQEAASSLRLNDDKVMLTCHDYHYSLEAVAAE